MSKYYIFITYTKSNTSYAIIGLYVQNNNLTKFHHFTNIKMFPKLPSFPKGSCFNAYFHIGWNIDYNVCRA